MAAEAQALGLLGDGGGDRDPASLLDPARVPDPFFVLALDRVLDPADQDAVPDRRRPYRGGGGARRQQGDEDEHADHGGGALVPEAGRAARSQAGHGQGGGHDHPGRRRGEPGPEEDPGGGGRGQRHPVHVGVRVGVAIPNRAGRQGWRHATVTRSFNWS
jgi:hypothetical protein